MTVHVVINTFLYAKFSYIISYFVDEEIKKYIVNKIETFID